MSARRDRILNLVLIAVSLLFTLGLCELVLRVAIFSDHFSLAAARQSWRYADGTFEDDYWKLNFLFEPGYNARNDRFFEPTLGWAPESRPDNPLRIVTNRSYDIEQLKAQPILFYGDSFVEGITAMEHKIPQILDDLLPDTPVVNYGVSGYGVDQIYLRYAKTVCEFDQPVVLVGILTRDLDRSILSFRGRQKPYFLLEDDRLVLQNDPISPVVQEFIDAHPPTINSYLARLAIFRLKSLLPDGWFESMLGYDEIHRKKVAINFAILREFKLTSEMLNIPVYAVLFYSYEELYEESWRGAFLKDSLDELDVPYLDTKPLLLSHIEATQINPYDDEHGHLDPFGNRLVAKWLVSWLRERTLNETPADVLRPVQEGNVAWPENVAGCDR